MNALAGLDVEESELSEPTLRRKRARRKQKDTSTTSTAAAVALAEAMSTCIVAN